MFFQQGIAAVSEQGFLGAAMFFNAAEQVLADAVEPGGGALIAIWRVVDDFVAKAEDHLVLVVEDPIPQAVAGLPVCEIQQVHHATSLAERLRQGCKTANRQKWLIFPTTSRPIDFAPDA